jgi:hypothetical protein
MDFHYNKIRYKTAERVKKRKKVVINMGRKKDFKKQRMEEDNGRVKQTKYKKKFPSYVFIYCHRDFLTVARMAHSV